MEITAETRSFAGRQLTLQHGSSTTGTDMAFSVYLPPQAEDRACPVLYYLSGLTCTWENVTSKGFFQPYAAEHGLIVVCPDTSPRGLDLPGEHDDYDFGSGAGFYVDATKSPWDANYQMYSYVTRELPDLVNGAFATNPKRAGVTGHSMGGHGALIVALRNPNLFKSVSAFAPIASPMRCPWGEKALSGYLGEDRYNWRAWDATALLEDGHEVREIFVDQGEADPFLERELKPDLLVEACDKAGVSLRLRRHPGYDHSYYFISSFMDVHLKWHAERLGAN